MNPFSLVIFMASDLIRAVNEIKYSFKGTNWFIEDDICGCFNNIDHKILLNLLENKIKDSKFLNFIRKFLKAGYLEDWKYHRTYSGTPQGGILSPILANIYLNELDNKVEQLASLFYKKADKFLDEKRTLETDTQGTSEIAQIT